MVRVTFTREVPFTEDEVEAILASLAEMGVQFSRGPNRFWADLGDPGKGFSGSFEQVEGRSVPCYIVLGLTPVPYE
jgi:hypothetical protein